MRKENVTGLFYKTSEYRLCLLRCFALAINDLAESFADQSVIELSHKFVSIRVDLTTEHPHQKELQERFNIKGVPTIIFINKNGIIENERIESLVDRDVVLKRMQRLIEAP